MRAAARGAEGADGANGPWGPVAKPGSGWITFGRSSAGRVPFSRSRTMTPIAASRPDSRARNAAIPRPVRIPPRMAAAAARHSLRLRPSARSARAAASSAPSTVTSSTPSGPSRSRPADSAAEPTSRPAAPPRPAPAGHSRRWPCQFGTAASTAPRAGRPASSAITRSGRLLSPRCEPSRHAQARKARPGSRPATPNPCNRMSAAAAPGRPARLPTPPAVAVSSEGSRG